MEVDGAGVPTWFHRPPIICSVHPLNYFPYLYLSGKWEETIWVVYHVISLHKTFYHVMVPKTRLDALPQEEQGE